MYKRDLAGTRHSPLQQINRTKVAVVRQVWRYPLGKDATSGGLTGGSESTPIVVGGVMYAVASDRVVALAPETGREIWPNGLAEGGVPSRRGLALWPGDAEHSPRIFFTSNQRNTRTG